MANTGGLSVITPVVDLSSFSKVQGITLMSDLHIGAANVDYALIKRELDIAYTHGDRILLGGDILDLILPSDHKRFLPSVLHPRLQGRNDVLNAAVEWAVELLSPYATLIDVIGVGNHETHIEKATSFDPVAAIIQQLEQVVGRGSCISHGGYQSYIQYKLPKGNKFVIWYHHGSGKSGKTHLELKKLIDQAQVFDADLYWSGHSHCKASVVESRVLCGETGLLTKDVRCVITGGYLMTYGDQDQQEIKSRGRRSNYAADQALRPHGLGGARVLLSFDKPGYPSKVEVVQ